jgi:hypothetical protein
VLRGTPFLNAKLNSTVDIAGVHVVTNERKPVAGAEHGVTVNAVHLTALDGDVDIVIASATSGIQTAQAETGRVGARHPGRAPTGTSRPVRRRGSMEILVRR